MRTSFRVVLLLTTVIAAGALALALTVAPSTEEKEQTRQAERVAEEYEGRLVRAVADLSAYVVKRRFENETNYRKLHDQVTARMDELPKIPKKTTTAFGREHSRDYRTAAARRELELKPFRELTTYLETQAIPRQEFVETGIEIVQINPVELLEGFAVALSGEPLRTEVVPAYKKARKKLMRQEPGTADAELARDLKRYVDDAITMTRDGADDIDAGRAFFFDFGDKPEALLTRLEATQRAIAAEVSAQVEAFDTVGTL